MRASRPENFSWAALYQNYPRWRKSLSNGATPLADELPWINFAVIDFLQRTLRPEMRVFEYGSGGSTLFFSQRVREVISVEHDLQWCHKVRGILRERNQKNCQLSLVEPLSEPVPNPVDPSDPDGYTSDDEAFRGWSFKTYACSIDSQPERSLDVVLVDGRARPSCLKHAIARTKAGGFVIVDNAERPYYHRSYQLLAGTDWKRRDFFGPGPYNRYFWQTNVWERLR